MTGYEPRCNLTVIRSNDLDQAAMFYGELGLELIKHRHGRGPEHLAHESGGHVFEVYPLADGQTPTSSVRIGFSVRSVDESFAKLVAIGGQATTPPQDSEWGRRAVVTDFDGHRVELTSNTLV